jgi:hypothetical protein
MRTDFVSPDHIRMDDMSLDVLRELMLDRGSDYWNSAPETGDAALEQQVGDRVRVMSLVLKEPFGFRVVHWGFEGEDAFVAAWSDDWTQETEIVLGGVPAPIPIAFLLPRELAWEAVREFCTTGNRYEKVRWVDEAREWP